MSFLRRGFFFNFFFVFVSQPPSFSSAFLHPFLYTVSKRGQPRISQFLSLRFQSESSGCFFLSPPPPLPPPAPLLVHNSCGGDSDARNSRDRGAEEVRQVGEWRALWWPVCVGAASAWRRNVGRDKKSAGIRPGHPVNRLRAIGFTSDRVTS